MVRAITSTLEAAQEAGTGTPYIYLNFTSADGGTTYDHSARLLQLEHHEEAYNDYATIILRDEDASITDLRGYYVDVGYGYTTSASNEYASTPRLWVIHQQRISLEGVLHVILELEGMWAILRNITLRLGEPPFYTEEYENDSVYDILAAILAEATKSLQTGSFSLNAIGDQSDDIIDVFNPQLYVNQRAFETCAGVMRRLIEMTKCFIRPKASLAFTIIYPQTADAVVLSYYSDQQFFFLEYMERKNVLTPNHILVICNAGDDRLYTDYVVGEASDADEIARFMDVYFLTMAAEITNLADANNRADALLTRIKAEVLSGRLICMHDCRVELYDRVAIYDAR